MLKGDSCDVSPPPKKRDPFKTAALNEQKIEQAEVGIDVSLRNVSF